MPEDTFPAPPAAPTTMHVMGCGAIALGTVALVLTATAVQGRLAGLGIDDAFYLLQADQYFGRLADEPGLAALLARRSYPPLYPLVLGLFGGGTGNLLAAYVVNAACIVLWTGCLLAWLLRMGATPVAGALLASAAALAPATLYHAPVLWSEHLFIVWALAALAVLERPRSEQAYVLGGALIGFAVLTRSAGVALVAAFALQLAVRRPPRALAALALAALPLLERLLHPTIPYAGELEVAARDLDALLAHIGASVSGLWPGWQLDWSMAVPPAAFVPALLLALATIGWVVRLRAWKLDALWVPLSVAMLLLWGFPAHAPRFLYPLCPVALVYAWLGLGLIARRWRNGAGVQIGLAAALAAVVVVPVVSVQLPRYTVALAPELAPLRRTQLAFSAQPLDAMPDRLRTMAVVLDDMRVVRERTPPDACVYTRRPGLLMVHAHRAPYLLRWTRHDELAAARDLPCAYAYIDAAGIDGRQDRATLEALGLEVLHVSPGLHPESDPEPIGVLVAFPVARGAGPAGLSPRG